jgi:uncharacterized membrane protein (UPF0182 family)
MSRVPALVLLGAVLLFAVPSSVNYYTDWLWFRELGYEGLFLRTLNAEMLVFAATFAAVFLALFLNFHLARRAMRGSRINFGTGPEGRPIAMEGGPVSNLVTPAALVVALVFAVAGSRHWMMWLNFANGVAFNQRDPQFGRDVSFYVYRLPLWQALQQQALIVAMLALVGCGLYYVLSGSFIIEPRRQAGFWPRLRLLPTARRHLGLLAAAVFFIGAWGAWLEFPSLMLTPGNVVFGASYTDIHARLPVLYLTTTVLVAGGLLAILQGFSRRSWPIPLGIAMFVTVMIGGSIYAASVQRFSVKPNEVSRESEYIARNIDATRRAYALDRVEEQEHSGDAALTARDIIANASTIENVRLWDHAPLLQTFTQIQEIRTYYEFAGIDNDRYMIDGKYRQVMLSARELNPDSIPNRSWMNERLIFTHGYGLTLGPVNQVTTEGLPVLLIRDLPPVSTANLKVDQPSIYFGESSSDYVLVRTRQPEFDYPKGEDNVKTTYAGTGGVSIGTFWRRLMFALRFADTDILFTNQLSADSRIMFNRRIQDRVQELAPFLMYDSDPYMVLSEGRLLWIQDAYTTTRNFPYATPAQYQNTHINYIRNSVKIVIDAYHGSVTFYLAEPADPLALTLDRIFPGLLKPMSAMPADLRRHVRYPEDIFSLQALLFQTYHMTNPQVFYNKEDQWQVPTIDVDRGPTTMQPYYTVMRLPGEKRDEFIQMLPFTPKNKDNLSAWMVARSDPDSYGKLLAFQFPKQKLVYGPKQIVGRINTDEVISPQVTLWNQQGSRVIWGTLLVIPIHESLLYVRPLYLQSPDAKIPQLKQVVVAYQERIEMAETLTRALARIFGPTITAALAPDRLASTATSVIATPDEVASGMMPNTMPDASAPPGAPLDANSAALITEIDQHWEAADKALRAGDLAAYGEEMKKARDAFERLKRIRK